MGSKAKDDEAKAAAIKEAAAKAAAQAAAAAMDRLEVDESRLDQKFDTWLPRDGGRLDGKLVASGLDQAMTDLWVTIGACADAKRMKRMSAAEMALDALREPLGTEPEFLGHAVEHCLSEYLLRMQRNLERWVQEDDVLAVELADVVQWFLFDAKPSFGCFNDGFAKLTTNPFSSWYDIADAIEGLLLREWESRACDEVDLRVQSAYAPLIDSREVARDHAHINVVLRVFGGAQEQWLAWRNHQAASERAVSVLIAALNAVLRWYRLSTESLVPQAPSAWRSKHERLNKALQGLGRRASSLSRITRKASGAWTCGAHAQRELQSPPKSYVAAAAVEAAQLADACKVAATGAISSVAACAEVLQAFQGAFEREAAIRCKLLADSYFAAEYHEILQAVRPGQRGRGQLCNPGGACDSANDFLEEVFGLMPTPCTGIACDLLTRHLLRRWTRQFCRARPRLSTQPELVELILSDERALKGLAQRWGAESLWSESGKDDPVHLLSVVCSLMKDPTPDTMAIGLPKLEELAGAEQGATLADVVRSSLHC